MPAQRPTAMSSTSRTRLRVRRYGGRLRHTVSGSGLRVPLVFMHLPKCGGTSLSEALYATVPIQNRIGVIDALSTRRAAALLHFGCDCPILCHDDMAHGHHTFALRRALLFQHMCWNSRLIHGHLLFSETARRTFGRHYRLITVLRDPAARMISNYRMARRAGLTAPDFSRYLETPLAAQHARVYLRYLSGQNAPDAADLDRLQARAIGRLAQFDLIGFLDRLPDFTRALRDLAGAALRIPRHNRSTDTAPGLSDGDRDRMAELLAQDQRIYDAARTGAGL